MLKLGYLFTPFAAIAWIVTMVIAAFIYLVPPDLQAHVPGHGMLVDFFVRYAFVGIGVLIVLNGLSAFTGPEHLQKFDRGMSIAACVYFSLVLLIVLLGGWNRETLSFSSIILLAVLTAFAHYDYFVHQGEAWRSRQVIREVERKDGVPDINGTGGRIAEVANATTDRRMPPWAPDFMGAGDVRMGGSDHFWFAPGSKSRFDMRVMPKRRVQLETPEKAVTPPVSEPVRS